MSSRLLPFAMSFAFVVLLFYVLITGRDMLIPFAIAIMVWYLLNALTRLYQRMALGGWHLPRALALTLSVLTFIIAIILLVEMISDNMAAAAKAGPAYQKNLSILISYLNDLAGFVHTPAPSLSELAERLLGQLDFKNLVGNIAGTVARAASNTGIIIIYVTFLFIEQKSFNKKIAALFKNPDREKSVRNMLHQMGHDIETYIWVKTMTSALTGIVSYAILAFVGVDFAAFWGLLVFLLNYIPNVGSLVAIVFPSLLALLQFDTVIPFLIVLGSLSIIQFLIGNVLEPRVMGNTLNLSPLVIILSLVLWGTIWGLAGMFLCVPIMVILAIICSYIPQARPVAILLSASGAIKTGA